MAKYVIDVNVPYHFFLWRSTEYVHIRDIDDTWSDRQVWIYAKERALTIVSKDADFSDRVLLEGSPPNVIHIRLGNMKMREFHRALSGIWTEVCEMSARCRLVRVFEDRLEGID
jgi:predicted nuclease of predicted toxin-antitoxin system